MIYHTNRETRIPFVFIRVSHHKLARDIYFKLIGGEKWETNSTDKPQQLKLELDLSDDDDDERMAI